MTFVTPEQIKAAFLSTRMLHLIGTTATHAAVVKRFPEAVLVSDRPRSVEYNPDTRDTELDPGYRQYLINGQEFSQIQAELNVEFHLENNRSYISTTDCLSYHYGSNGGNRRGGV